MTRSSSSLQINGVTARFAGANAYWLGLDDNNGVSAGSFPSHNQITNAMSGMKSMGINLVRAHTVGISTGTSNSYETAAGVFNDANLDAADWAVYQAKLNGVYLMVPLTDNWNYYHGGKWNFCHWAYQQNSSGLTDCPGTTKDDSNERQFFTNNTACLRIRALFKNYIYNWLYHYNPYTGLRYKDDPTIAILETGNEIYYAAQIGSNEWTQDICSYIKSIAPDKLCADGSCASGTTVASSPGITAAACDIASPHYYPEAPDYSSTVGLTVTNSSLGSSTSATLQIGADVASAVANSKAYLVGEYPWTRPDVSSLYSTVESNTNISGDMFWSFIPTTDSGTAETHGGSFGSDDYPLHWPYSGSSEQTYGPALSRHIAVMSGVAATNGAATGSLVTNLVAVSALSRASNASLMTAGSASIANDTSMWMEGGSSLKVTPSASGVYPYVYFTTPSSGASVTAGSQYTAVASARTTTSGSFGFQAVLAWYKSDGTYLSSSTGTYSAISQAVWTQYTVTASAPTNAAYAVAQIQAGATMGTGDIFNVDQFGIFAGTTTTWVAS